MKIIRSNTITEEDLLQNYKIFKYQGYSTYILYILNNKF